MDTQQITGTIRPPDTANSGNDRPSLSAVGSLRNPSVSEQSTPVQKLKQPTHSDALVKTEAKKLELASEPIYQNLQRKLQFQVDDSTGQTVVSVIDRETNETIRQIPPEEILNLSRRLKELADAEQSPVGVLIRADI